MLLSLLVQTLLLPGVPMPAQYLEVQRNWRVDESGAPMLSTERRKAFAVEVADGVRRKRNLESGLILEEAVGAAQGFGHLLGTHELRVSVVGGYLHLVAEPKEGGARRYEFVFCEGGLARQVVEVVGVEKSLGVGSRIVTKYEAGRMVEVEVDFLTVVAGERYRGLQRTRIEVVEGS